MIPITKLSASQDSKWEWCENQCFIGYYLKYEDAPRLKTVMGTVCHKVFEILAKAKRAKDAGENKIDDEVLGGYFDIPENWLKSKKLSSSRINSINKSRADKKIYKHDTSLGDNHSRLGEDFVEYLISLAYAWYSNLHTEFEWTKEEYTHITNWVWATLEYKNGLYDPRLLKIIDTEKIFEIELDQDWAKYHYSDDKKGFLKVKGVIDLVIERNGIYEIIDYKSGERKNWNTGKIKEYKDFEDDEQLLIYNYAARLKYPEIEHFEVTIFYLRHGGPFTMHYGSEKILQIEQHLKDRFLEIKNCKEPKLISYNQRGFKCEKLCPYSNYNGTNLCKEVHEYTRKYGIEATIKKYKQERNDTH